MGFLKEIVNEVIEDKLSIEGKMLDDHTIIISEGLIKTYPIDRVVDFLRAKYNLSDCQTIFIPEGYNGNCYIQRTTSGGKRIYLLLRANTDFEKIRNNLVKYGYECNYCEEVEKNNISYVEIIFEKKFDEELTDSIHNQFEYIYHISPDYLEDKIKKNGLVPKITSWKNNSFPNNDRLYFFLRIPEDLEFWCQNFKDNKDSNKHNIKHYYLYKINVEQLNDNIIFYLDPRMKNAVYTKDCINPNAITLIEKIDVI